MRRIEWVLFDLGGVLVDVDQSRIFKGLAAKAGLDEAFVAHTILESLPLNTDFIVKEYLPAQLTAEVNHALGTALREEEVVEAVNAELGEPIQSTAELLPKLRFRAKVGCLSNTNSIHWEQLLKCYPFMNDFDRRFASQLVGYAKPGREIYLAVADLLGARPARMLFFDDKLENVLMAQQLGWNARLYQNHSSLIAELVEFGVL